MADTRELKDAFNLYDRKGTGNIAASSLGDLLRAVGQNPSEAEIRDQISLHDAGATGLLSFDTFSKIVNRPDGYKPAASVPELIDGFRAFDPENTGVVSGSELRHVLTTMGEALSPEEIDSFMAGVAVDKDGNVNYEAFVRNLLA
ncbi:EF-hand protein [Mortierella sp. GBAus27b]|nr:EF-hand protein [Mortierella sp. GBAus27b]